MDADATIALEDTVVGTVSEVGGYGMAVSSATVPTSLTNVLFDRVLVKTATNQTSIIPTGIEFPDSTIQVTAANPFDGGAITGPITMVGAIADTEMSGNFFNVELSSDNSQFSELNFDSLTVAGTAGNMVVNPTGLIFPDASVQTTAYTGGGGDFLPLAGGTMTGAIVFDGTSGQYINKGNFDTSRGGNYGISLVCSIGYEFNWQAGWLTTTQQSSTTPRPLYLDSLAGTTLRSWNSATDTGTEVAHTGITFADSTTQDSAAYVVGSGDLDMMGNNITNANFDSAAGQVSAQNITMSSGGVLTFGDSSVQTTAYTGGGSGIPEAPQDNYVYGRVNAMWYRIPGVSPFSQIATNVTSVASWTVSGADVFLSPSGTVSTNNASGVSAFNLNGGSTSSTVFDFSSMTSLSGNVYLVSQAATATPVFATYSGLSFLYYGGCQFSSLPSTIGSFPNLTTLNVVSCPNITDVSSAPSSVTTMSITNSPVTSFPSFANVSVLTLAGVAITSGPSLDYNTNISQFYCGSNASMTTAPSLNGCTSLGTVSIYDNPLMATAPSFTGCSGLGALNVYGNDLMPYPPGISGCSSLGNIQCYNNPLMTSFGSLSGLTSLSYVDLHNCAITDCDSIGYACASNASNYGIFYGYLNVSGGTNQTFDSTSLPSWIGDLQSMSWTVVYNSY